jgi:hypothetical protein
MYHLHLKSAFRNIRLAPGDWSVMEKTIMSKHRPARSSSTVNSRQYAPWLARAVILAAINIAVTATAHAADYYVAENGKDSNPGTINSPWKSIQYAANRVQAGDTVNIRGGTYVESIALKSSGSAKQGYITFQSYPGEQAIISGTKLPVSEEQGLISIVDLSYIKIVGLEIRDYTTSALEVTPIGILISGQGNAIRILKNHIHHISSTAKPSPSGSCNGSNPQAHGILVSGDNETSPIVDLTIDENELDQLTLGCSEALSVNGNVMTWKVTNNRIHDNDNIGIDAIGFEDDKQVIQARGGEITGNKVYNITTSHNPAYGNQRSAAGVYCDGCTGVSIEGNTIYNSDYGVEIASEHKDHFSSKVIVRNNLIYGNALSGLTIGGSNKDNTGGADSCTFVNNSFYGNNTSGNEAEFQIQHHAKNITFENNIVHAGSHNRFIIGKTTTSAVPTADGNLYFLSAAAAGSGEWTANNVTYKGFDKYRDGTKQEKSSAFADPQYRDPSKDDLQVAKTSPAVDQGLSLSQDIVGTKDVAGAARVQGKRIDIGAYEQ